MIESKKRIGVFGGAYTESLVVKSLLEINNILMYEDDSLIGFLIRGELLFKELVK